MSGGQKARTLVNFPRMKYRAAKRHPRWGVFPVVRIRGLTIREWIDEMNSVVRQLLDEQEV